MKIDHSGIFGDCLKDFFKRFGKRKELWQFAKVNSDTERTWRNQGVMPQGVIRLRVMFFLRALGYRVTEIESAPVPVINTAACVAFSVATMEEVADEIKIRPQKFHSYLHFRKPSPEKLPSLQEFASKRRIDLLSAIVAAGKEYFVKFDALPAGSTQEALPADGEFAELRKACATVRKIGDALLRGPVQKRNELRQYMNKFGKPELHQTWDVLHRLMKERQEQ